MEAHQKQSTVPVTTVQATEESMELLQVLIKLADPQSQGNKQHGQSSSDGTISLVSAEGTQNNTIMVVEGNQIDGGQGQGADDGGSQNEQLQQAVASIVSSGGTDGSAIMLVEATGNQMQGQEGTTMAQLSGDGMENVVVHFTGGANGEQSLVVPVNQELEEGEVVATSTKQVKRRRIEGANDGGGDADMIPGQEELMSGKIFKYKCTMCSKMYETPEALEIHMTKELQQKRFGCLDCGKRFKTREGFRCHRRIHTGETPYKCDECDLKFNNRTAFRYHQELKHSDEEFICKHCNKVFTTRQCLRKHMVLAHREKVKTKAQKREQKEQKRKMKKLKKLIKLKQEEMKSVVGQVMLDQVDPVHSFLMSIGATVVSLEPEGEETLNVNAETGEQDVITFEDGTVINNADGVTLFNMIQKEKKNKKRKKRRRLGRKLEAGEVKLRCPRKTAHLVRNFKCEHCPGQYTLRKNLFKHIRAKHPEFIPPKPVKAVYTCDYCGIHMRTKTYKREHERIHTGEKPFTCRLGCEKAFSRSGARNEHERSVHLKENKATCEICNKTFDRRELRHHATIHTGEKPFRCPYCQNSYTQKKIMNKHIRRAHPGFDVPAPVPRKRNSNKIVRSTQKLDNQKIDEPDVALVQSIKDQNILQESGVIEMQVYKCKYCEKLFNNLEHLTNHENIHIQTKHYQCGQCGKMFKRPEGLTRHIGKHTGGFQCPTCGLNLPTYTKLQLHEEEHLYKCKMCKRKHETKEELIEHMKVHMKNTDRYQCMHCNKILATKSSLREHEKIHTEKVKCNYCDKMFVSHYMKKHLRTHSGVHPYICKHCPDRRYTTPNALRVHMRRRHSAAATRTDYQATIVINPEALDKDKKMKEEGEMVLQHGVTIHDIEGEHQSMQMQLVTEVEDIEHHGEQLQVSQSHANPQPVINVSQTHAQPVLNVSQAHTNVQPVRNVSHEADDESQTVINVGQAHEQQPVIHVSQAHANQQPVIQVSQAHGSQQPVIHQVISSEFIRQEVLPQILRQQEQHQQQQQQQQAQQQQQITQIIPTHVTKVPQTAPQVSHDSHVTTFTIPDTYVHNQQQQPPSYSQVTQQATNSHITLSNVPSQHVYIDIPYTQHQPVQQQDQQQQITIQQDQQQQQPQITIQQAQFHY